MKKFLLLAMALAAGALNASAGAIEDVVDLLHQAKDSPSPVPLLEKAKAEFGKYKPGPNETKEAAAGVGPKRRAGAKLGAEEMKKRAEEALDHAVEAAKNSDAELPSKIDAAIAEVHHTGTMKH